jgi:ACS family glucarate transporter-like MFS transporter
VTSPETGSQSLRPSHVRWRVMALLLVVTALTFLDRLNLSIAGKFIQDEFHIGTQSMGWILSAFVLGYALFQVPAGWLGEKYGPRCVVTAAILWWSLFSAATAIAPRLPLRHWFGTAWSFALVRFAIGLGEGAAFPNANKIVASWMGAAHRGVGNSIFLAGIGVGGTTAPIAIAWAMNRWGWRTSFYLCGALGVLIAAAWHFYVTDSPAQHPGVNAAELANIQIGRESAARGSTSGRAISLVRLFSNSSVVGLVLSFFLVGYASYFYYTWFYLYLLQVRHLSVMQGGGWSSSPFLAMMLLTPLGGWVSDASVVRFGRRRGRRFAAWVGLGLASTFLLLGSHVESNSPAIVLLAIGAGFLGFAGSSWWAACIDLAPHHSGPLAGLMNMGGNLGGWVSPVLTAYMATRFGWSRALDFAAVTTALGGVAWFMVDAGRNLEARAC